MKVICFFLPQFHPIPENDEWWGKGFTEWRNVMRARPLFPGHVQPRLPADLGYYDLRVAAVREQQAELARQAGIHGFCYYHYWFGGRRLLERPVDEMIASGRPDMPFCLCWANENWSRRWDGSENELLIEQTYNDSMAGHLIESLMPAFRDPRYITVDGKPLFLVYHAKMLDNPRRSTTLWREEARKRGIDDLYLCRMNTFCQYGLEDDPGRLGFDASVEFPPHGCSTAGLSDLLLGGRTLTPGAIYDYDQVVHASVHRADPQFKLFRGVMPGWDNTARKPGAPTIYFGATPDKYRRWLIEMLRWTASRHQGDERLVFINAWNEWAEGAYLEPDEHFGSRYLQATAGAIAANADGRGCGAFERDPSMEIAVYSAGDGGRLCRDGEPLLPAATIDGAVELVSGLDGRLRVRGWACDRSAPFDPLHIVLFDGKRQIGQARSGLPRPDLADAGGLSSLASGFEAIVHHGRLGASAAQDLRVFAVSRRLEFAPLPMPAPTEGERACVGQRQAGGNGGEN